MANQMGNDKQQVLQKIWAKVVAKAWNDQAFKERLLKNPDEVFKENGVNLPSGIQCKVNENTDKVFNLILPQKPAGELSEEDLKQVAAGRAADTLGAAGSAFTWSCR